MLSPTISWYTTTNRRLPCQNKADNVAPCAQEDIGIAQNQFNVGQQMLSLGIVLFEIPSNMLLYRVGPGKWLTLQLFLFGLVSTFQAFQNSYGSFVATRLILGITESGFIPGGLWTLSTWLVAQSTSRTDTLADSYQVYSGRNRQTGHGLLLWQPIWTGLR